MQWKDFGTEKLSDSENNLAKKFFTNSLEKALSPSEKKELEKFISLFYKLASQREVSPNQLE